MSCSLSQTALTWSSPWAAGESFFGYLEHLLPSFFPDCEVRRAGSHTFLLRLYGALPFIEYLFPKVLPSWHCALWWDHWSGCVWHGAALASPQRSLQPAPLLSPHHGHSVQWIPARRPFLRGRARRKSWVVDPSCLPKAICENRQRRFFFLCGVQNYMDFLSLEILFAGWWTIIQLQRGVLCVKAGLWWRACPTVASSRSHCPPPIAPSGTCGQVLSTQWWPVEGWCWKGFLRSEALEQEEYFKGKEGRRLVGLRLFGFPEAVWDVGSTQGDRLGQGWGNGLASMAGTGPGECLSSPALGGGDGCGVLQPPVTVTVMFSSAAVQGWSCDAHATWASYWSFRFADSWSFVNSYQYEPNS